MKSLQQRLSFRLTTAVGALLILFSAIAYPFLSSVLQQEFDYALGAKVKALTTPSTPSARGFSLRFTEMPGAEFLAGAPAPEFFEVRAADGSLVAKSPSLGPAGLALPSLGTNWPAFYNVVLPNDRAGRAVAQTLGGFAEGTEGGFIVIFARDTAQLRRASTLVACFLLGGTFLLTALAAWLARSTTRAGLQPVKTLADDVTAIDANSLATRLRPMDSPVELAPIVEQTNALLDRLREAFERERRFSASVAHELLTPVAELRALAENAVRWRTDPEASVRLAEDVLESAREMECLVTTLLAFARSERGELPVKSESVDLARIIRAFQQQSTACAVERKLAAGYSLPGEATVQSDECACTSMLHNVLENAFTYTPKGGRIECRLVADAHAYVVTVANTNPGLAATDLPRLWEPFWRKDAARTDRRHAGLGLALVHTLARSLNVTVGAKLVEPDLVEIRLQFPITTKIASP